MLRTQIEEIEVNLLLEAIFQRYGYDFRNYSRASIERRARNFLSRTKFDYISELIPNLMYDEILFESLVREFSITVTEMFRDPFVYRTLRERVFPFLKTYPFIRIWHAGCATGEEVYSIAILLKEEGLFARATAFATDFNDWALDQSKEGVYPIDSVKKFTLNYQQAGGKQSFSEYYHANYDAIVMNPSLKKNITFANHNLVNDGVFSEVHLIFCRNVLIYFNKDLQNRALKLFRNSLVRGGFLCLGTKETIQFSEVVNDFKVFDEKAKVFQKI